MTNNHFHHGSHGFTGTGLQPPFTQPPSVPMATNTPPELHEDELATDRVSLRITTTKVHTLETEYGSVAPGVRDAMEYLTEHAPLDAWDSPPQHPGADLDARGPTKRVTIRVPHSLLSEVDTVVEGLDRKRSRAIREALRSLNP